MQAWKAFYADRWQPTEPKAELSLGPGEQNNFTSALGMSL